MGEEGNKCDQPALDASATEEASKAKREEDFNDQKDLVKSGFSKARKVGKK